MAWDYAIDGQQQVQSAGASSAPFDPTKISAALATQAAGADGRTILTGNSLLSIVNPIAAPRWVPPYVNSGGDWMRDTSGDMVLKPNAPGYFISSNGTILNSPDGGKTFTDKYDNPTGNGSHDQAYVTYGLSADGKSAVPISASNQYQAGEWVSNGRDVAKMVAAMAAAYAGGTALAGMDAGTGVAAGGEAAAEGGGAAAGGGGAATEGATGSATSFGSGGYDFGAGSGATFGGSGSTAGVDALGTGVAGGSGITDAYAGLEAAGASGGTMSASTTQALSEGAQKAGQSVLDFAKSPAGLKLIAAGVAAAAAGGGSGSSGSGATTSQTGMAAAQAALAQDEVAWNKQAYANGQPTRDAATAGALTAQTGQLATQAGQTAVANDYDAYNKSTLRPLEQKIATDAMGYDTAGRRADAIAGATSDVEQAYANSNASANRQMQRAGVTPGSGRMQSLLQEQTIAKANSIAGASTSAVRNVETTGATRMADAAKMLSYLPAAQATAAGTATAAGSAAANSGANAVATQGAGVTNVNAGYAGAVSANNSAGNLYGQAASENNKTASEDAKANAAIGSAIGTYLGSEGGSKTVGDLANWLSDKEKKKGTGKRGNAMQALAQINKTPVETGWSYDKSKGGPSDGGKKHTGPMAQSVHRTMGETVAPGGKSISPMDMNGKILLGMQALSKRLDKIEKQA